MFYTQSVVRILYLVRVLYLVRSPHFIPSPCFIPCPQSVVRSPQSVFYTDRFANCGLNTEAELLLATAGKFDT